MPSHNRPELSDKAKKYIAAASIAVFVLLTAAIAWFVGRPMLKFVSEPDASATGSTPRADEPRLLPGHAAFAGVLRHHPRRAHGNRRGLRLRRRGGHPCSALRARQIGSMAV